MKTQPLKGMRDLLPREQALRDYIQGQILATYRAAGFQRISTPILEDMENLDKSDGGASIFTFNIKGGREEAFKFIDNLKIFSLLANVADVKSLVIHPASTTHSQLNDQELAEQQIYQNTIRLSIGTEHIDDIIADLEAGFAAVRGE